MTIKQIVAAVEYRSNLEAVLRTGLRLSQRFDALLVLVYVIPTEDGPRYAGGLTLGAVMDDIAREQSAYAEKVRRLVHHLPPHESYLADPWVGLAYEVAADALAQEQQATDWEQVAA